MFIATSPSLKTRQKPKRNVLGWHNERLRQQNKNKNKIEAEQIQLPPTAITERCPPYMLALKTFSAAELLRHAVSIALALVVGVSTGLNLSLFMSTSSWKAKSGSLPSPPADFAPDNATKIAPGFLASKPWSPGWTTTYLNASPEPTVIPWHSWCVVPHASRNGTCRRLHRHAHSVEWLTGTIGTTVGSSFLFGGPLYPWNLTRTTSGSRAGWSLGLRPSLYTMSTTLPTAPFSL